MRARAVALGFAVLIFGSYLAVAPRSAGAVSRTFEPTDDTYASSRQSGQVYGQADQLDVRLQTGESATDHAYLRFAVGGITGTVERVRLRLFAVASSDDGGSIHRTSSSWDEGSLVWDNAPDIGSATLASVGPVAAGTWTSVDLDPSVITGDGVYAFAMTSNSGDLAAYASHESDNPPQLEIDVASSNGSPAPASPSGTSSPADTSAPAPSATPTPSTTPAPTVTPTPPSTSSDGAPAIPAGYGAVLRKDFSDGSLAPFRILTYPNLHPGDLMVQYGTYASDPAHVSVHDGYLDLRATRNANGSWTQAFVGTGLTGDGTPPTFEFQYGTSRVMARMNSGDGAWQSIWYLIADSWGSPEIDWAELINGHLTANLHGTAADGQYASMSFDPTQWHEYAITKTPSYIAFLLDGKEIARANVTLTARMGLLADAKVGLTAPDSTTPSTLYLQIAWWTVDP